MMDWQTLRNQFMRDIGGDPPGAQLEDELIAAYTDHPDAVTRSFEKITLAYQAGKIRSPWGALKTEVGKATEAARNPKPDTSRSRSNAIQRAEQWLKTAGVMFDRQSEIEDELWGERGLIREHDTPAVRKRLLDLWQTERPRGERTEAEHDAYMARYQEQRAAGL